MADLGKIAHRDAHLRVAALVEVQRGVAAVVRHVRQQQTLRMLKHVETEDVLGLPGAHFVVLQLVIQIGGGLGAVSPPVLLDVVRVKHALVIVGPFCGRELNPRQTSHDRNNSGQLLTLYHRHSSLHAFRHDWALPKTGIFDFGV